MQIPSTVEHRISKKVQVHWQIWTGSSPKSQALPACGKKPVTASSRAFEVHRITLTSKSSTQQIVKKLSRCQQSQNKAVVFIESSAHPLPDEKLVSKNVGKSCAVLTRHLHELHLDFVEASESSPKISFSQFVKCRPAHVHPLRYAHLPQCLWPATASSKTICGRPHESCPWGRTETDLIFCQDHWHRWRHWWHELALLEAETWVQLSPHLGRRSMGASRSRTVSCTTTFPCSDLGHWFPFQCPMTERLL